MKSMKISTIIIKIISSMILNVLQGGPTERISLNSSLPLFTYFQKNVRKNAKFVSWKCSGHQYSCTQYYNSCCLVVLNFLSFFKTLQTNGKFSATDNQNYGPLNMFVVHVMSMGNYQLNILLFNYQRRK